MCIDRRPVLAGILFGLLTFKPHLGVLIPFALLVLGAWRVIAVAAVTTLLLVAGSVAVFGTEPWQRFVGETSGYQLSLVQGFEGFYTRMMASVLAAARTFGLSYQTALAIQDRCCRHCPGERLLGNPSDDRSGLARGNPRDGDSARDTLCLQV